MAGRRRRRRRRVSPVAVVIGLIIVVAAAGAGSVVINHFRPTKEMADTKAYFGIESEEEVALVVNGTVLEESAEMIGGQVYLPLDTVNGYINSRFYWDQDKGKLLYTTTERMREIAPDSTADADSEGSPILVSQDDGYWVSFDFVSSVGSVSMEEYSDPARIVIRTEWTDLKTAVVTEDSAVRQRGGIKSPILKNISAEDEESVYVIEDLDDWMEVETSDGFRGYIETEALGEQTDVEAPAQPESASSILRDHKINLAWHQVTSQDGNAEISNVLSTVSGTNVISPTWFSVTGNDGTISSLANTEYATAVHTAGNEVWGLIDNFNTEVDMLQVLSSSNARQNIISQLLSYAQSAPMDGINVDFEQVTEEEAPHYLQFVRELTLQAHSQNLVVSVDVPVPKSFNEHYNLGELGAFADYVIMMGYDEHYRGSEEAGSVASLPFVEEGIAGMVEQIPSKKVINAIPFYTRVWIENFGSGALESEVLGMDGAQTYIAEHQMQVQWDDSVGQNVAQSETSDARYTIWVEDEASLRKKLELLEKYQLGGVAEWKLGFENSAIWSVISEYLNY